MPTYSFRNIINDEIIARIMSFNEYDKLPKEEERGLAIYEEEGEIYHRALDVDIVSTSNQSPKGWPRKSYAAAVPAWEAKEMTEKAKAAGVPTEHDSYGRPTLTDAAHNKKYMEFRGLTDFDGGYGSPDCRGSQSEHKENSIFDKESEDT